MASRNAIVVLALCTRVGYAILVPTTRASRPIMVVSEARAASQAYSAHTEVDAPRERVWAAVLNLEAYPAWARAISKVEVLRTVEGTSTPRAATFTAGAVGLSVSYTLEYTIGDDTVAWVSTGGDVKSIIGQYRVTSLGDARTRLDYSLEVDPGFGVPGFVRRAVTKIVVRTALPELKRHLEL
mmetsp:Transcript_737/g.1123  ORF Transcript_737/g.1123 Transcript_737/m.1123 type:complete len:183 (-) Transcript_737:258-806(-)